MNGNRPGIWQTGRVTDNGHTVTITGWGLSLCAAGCTCHRHPATQHITIAEDDTAGLLGLVSYRPCDCCQAWTADELAAIVRDIACIAALTASGQS